jgi:myo-inositol 2-dehydrogenase / D-chiro-inositol 1-dehydrogenase
VRVAVVGTGIMGGTHATILGSLPDVTEVLVVDADADRAAEVARTVDGRAVALDDALGTADAVVVATTAASHAAIVEAAVAHRLPVLCEKPLTTDLASSIELTALVEAGGAHVEVGFQRRHDPGFAAARASVADGSVGKVHLLRLTAFDPRFPERPISFWPEEDAAPMFVHSSIHDFDFARWLTGEEVVEVTTEGSRRDEPRPADPRGIETAVVTMRLSGGGLAVLEASWLHPSGYDIRAELLADHAHLTMGLSGRSPARHLDWAIADDGVPAAWSGYLERFEAAYRQELVAFLAACRGERPAASSARDGLEAMRIAVAATRAYVERRPVPLSEVAGGAAQPA